MIVTFMNFACSVRQTILVAPHIAYQCRQQVGGQVGGRGHTTWGTPSATREANGVQEGQVSTRCVDAAPSLAGTREEYQDKVHSRILRRERGLPEREMAGHKPPGNRGGAEEMDTLDQEILHQQAPNPIVGWKGQGNGNSIQGGTTRVPAVTGTVPYVHSPNGEGVREGPLHGLGNEGGGNLICGRRGSSSMRHEGQPRSSQTTHGEHGPCTSEKTCGGDSPGEDGVDRVDQPYRVEKDHKMARGQSWVEWGGDHAYERQGCKGMGRAENNQLNWECGKRDLTQKLEPPVEGDDSPHPNVGYRCIHQQKVTFGFTRIICILIQIIRKMHEIQTEGL